MKKIIELRELIEQNNKLINKSEITIELKENLLKINEEMSDRINQLESELKPYLNQLKIKEIKFKFFKSLSKESLKGKDEAMNFLRIGTLKGLNYLNNNNKLIRFSFQETPEEEPVFYYPLFQFDDNHMPYPYIDQIIEIFKDNDYSFLNYLLNPCHYLRGMKPIDLIKIGKGYIIVQNHDYCYMEMGDKQAITFEEQKEYQKII